MEEAKLKPEFFLGTQDAEGSSSEEESQEENATLNCHKETQTDPEIAIVHHLAHLPVSSLCHEPKLSDVAPRLLDECLAIMNSDVSVSSFLLLLVP